MKNIKMFESDKLNKVIEKFPKRPFDEITKPEEPIKRKLTREEFLFMVRNFKNHSWNPIDNQGRIILSGGKSSWGMNYITEEDLKQFMEEENHIN
jgi:hypothetical protein